MMMTATIQLSESLQNLIDARLDTIDRMLIGRLSRVDRLAIVREVEAQVLDLLQARDVDQASRDDVLSVLGQLDPPEAYLPEDFGEGPPGRASLPIGRPASRPVEEPKHKGFAQASGIIGLCSLGASIVLPILVWVFAMMLQSEIVLFGGGGLAVVLGLAGSITALVLSIVARLNGAWAIVGLIMGIFSPIVLASATILGFFIA